MLTPLDPNVPIEANPDGNEGDRSNSYARLVGELQWIANCTRPDIQYTVNRLASYNANPSLQHTTVLKRLLRYLSSTRDFGITYRKTSGEKLFVGYADASFGSVDEYKSVTGYVFIAGGAAIVWKSVKQSVIAMSSTEAEYVALSEAGCEVIWLRNLYSELGFIQSAPTVV